MFLQFLAVNYIHNFGCVYQMQRVTIFIILYETCAISNARRIILYMCNFECLYWTKLLSYEQFNLFYKKLRRRFDFWLSNPIVYSKGRALMMMLFLNIHVWNIIWYLSTFTKHMKTNERVFMNELILVLSESRFNIQWRTVSRNFE